MAAALGDLPTDRYLPPGFADARAHEVGRNVRRARVLMGRRTGRLALAVCSQPECAAVGRAVRANLRRIGIGLRVKRYGGEIAVPAGRRRSDIVLARALAPYPDPVAFLRIALGSAAPTKRLHMLAQLPSATTTGRLGATRARTTTRPDPRRRVRHPRDARTVLGSGRL